MWTIPLQVLILLAASNPCGTAPSTMGRSSLAVCTDGKFYQSVNGGPFTPLTQEVAALILGGQSVTSTVPTETHIITGPPKVPHGVPVHVSSGRLKVICDNGGDATIRPSKFGSIIVDCGTK